MTNYELHRFYNVTEVLKEVNFKYIGVRMKLAVWRDQTRVAYFEIRKTLQEMEDFALKSYIDRMDGEIDKKNPPTVLPADVPEKKELDKALVKFSQSKTDKKIKIKVKIPMSWLEHIREDSKVIPSVEDLEAILAYVEDDSAQPVPLEKNDEESP